MNSTLAEHKLKCLSCRTSKRLMQAGKGKRPSADVGRENHARRHVLTRPAKLLLSTINTLRTRNNGSDTVKTPLGMFEQETIPNDHPQLMRRLSITTTAQAA